MLGKLTDEQIEKVIKNEILGRIGCHADGTTYIVPICYAYDGEAIFARSNDGLKIDIMRENPEVCFEIEDVKDMANWQTVILWGRFEEITDQEQRQYALEQLLHRHRPIVTGEISKFTPNWPFNPNDFNQVDGVVYKIAITKKTGRFENYKDTQEISQSFL